MRQITAVAICLLAATRGFVVAEQPSGKVVEAFYQEVDIQRKPQFRIQGLPVEQNTHYRIRSYFRLYEPDAQGVYVATQEIREAELLKADPLSQSIFPAALAKLEGKTMTYTLDSFGAVMKFSGYENDPNPRDIKAPGLQGALITNVIDEDGWQELARLTLFRPPGDERRGTTFQFRTEHDWASLGRWYGQTDVRRGRSRGNLRQYFFQHKLQYNKPAPGKGDSPLVINDAEFDLYRADGEIHYDTKSRRVAAVREWFAVRGTVKTELLGSEVDVGLMEEQMMTISVKADKFEIARP